jgi:predicted dehydrogenase
MSKLQILVIGVGSIGERHHRCFGRTRRVEASICEVNAELRETIAARYGVARRYADLDEALKDRSARFDIAVVATPANLHVALATRLAEAGIHLFVEKPLSTSLEDTLTVIGERGTARCELPKARWMSMAEPGDQWREKMVWDSERDSLFISQANAYLDAAGGKAPVLCTLAEARQTLRVNLALLRTVENPAWTRV